MMMMTDKHRN